MKKIVLFIVDGLGDLPCKALGGKTPLEAAATPNLDKLAANGLCGKLVPLGLGSAVPLVDGSLMTFSLLGYDVRQVKPKRGPLEIIGLGKKCKEGELVARCNFATVRNGLIRDLRAVPSKRALEKIRQIKLNVPFKLFKGPNYRAIVVFRAKFGDNLSTVDPHKVGAKVKQCRALDKKSRSAARIVNEFVEKSAKALAGEKANCILPRGFGSSLPRVQKISTKYEMSVAGTAASPVDKGILKVCGIMTAKNADMRIIHYKDADPPSHNGDPIAKKRAIEAFDRTLTKLDLKDTVIVVTADHCTPCKLKRHSNDLVPVLVSPVYGAGKKKFGERFCTDFRVPQHELFNFVFKVA